MSPRFLFALLPRRPARRGLAALMLALAGACSAAPRAEAPFAAADNDARPPMLPIRVADAARSPYGDFLAGRHAERLYDFERAADLFAHSLRHSPDNPALMRQTLHQMLAAGQFDGAVAISQRYLQYEPQSVIAGLALGVDDLAAGRTQAAEARLKTIPARGLGSYFVPLAMSWTQVALGRLEAALEALAPLSGLRGGKPFHDYHAALIHARAGNTEEARKLFDALGTEGYVGYSRMVLVAGAFYERNGGAGKARAIYEGYLARRPDTVVIEAALDRVNAGGRAPEPIANATEGAAEAMFNMATLLSQENVPEIAMMLDQMALRLRPRFDHAKVLRGDILESTGRHEAAIAAYETVDPDTPMGWAARLRAAQLLDRVGKREQALARLRDMAAERPGRADVMIVMGDLLRFNKRYPEAIEAYDAAFARIGTADKRHWSLYYSRAVSLERAQRWERAEGDFLKALQFEPDQPLVLNYLGYSWVEQRRNLGRALDMIERAVKLRPNDGFIIDSLGWAHYQLGNYKRAVNYLERAVELTSLDPTINDHLGDAYWQVGRHYEARFQWRRALALEPEPGDVAKIEKKLANGLVDAVGGKGATSEAGGSPRGG